MSWYKLLLILCNSTMSKCLVLSYLLSAHGFNSNIKYVYTSLMDNNPALQKHQQHYIHHFINNRYFLQMSEYKTWGLFSIILSIVVSFRCKCYSQIYRVYLFDTKSYTEYRSFHYFMIFEKAFGTICVILNRSVFIITTRFLLDSIVLV